MVHDDCIFLKEMCPFCKYYKKYLMDLDQHFPEFKDACEDCEAYVKVDDMREAVRKLISGERTVVTMGLKEN